MALVAENRPEWVIADLAIMAAGGITVPAYTTNTSTTIATSSSNSGARVAIVSTAALAQRFLPAMEQVASVETLIAIEQPLPGQSSHADLRLWRRGDGAGRGRRR